MGEACPAGRACTACTLKTLCPAAHAHTLAGLGFCGFSSNSDLELQSCLLSSPLRSPKLAIPCRKYSRRFLGTSELLLNTTGMRTAQHKGSATVQHVQTCSWHRGTCQHALAPLAKLTRQARRKASRLLLLRAAHNPRRMRAADSPRCQNSRMGLAGPYTILRGSGQATRTS